jgi:serine/threonine protein kinase
VPPDPLEQWLSALIAGQLPAATLSQLPQLDEYRLLQPLGRGAMGCVYAAHDTVLDRPVAIKLMSAMGEQARERFLNEARAIARLSHPNVVAIHRVGSIGDVPYLVSEYIRGEGLDRLPLPQPESEVLRIAIQLCRGLSAAHRRGVLHRDIKPANLLISGDGVVKVADSGIAKLMSDATAVLTRTGTVLGTPAYMAPELIQGAPPAPAIDVYAAGTVLYELLCGSLPFPPRPDAMAQLYQRVNEDPIPLHRRAPSLPAALGAVTARALQRDPAQRYATAGELAAAVTQAARSAWGEQWLQASGVSVKTAVATVTPTEPPPTPPRFRILGPIEVSDEQGRLLSLGGLKPWSMSCGARIHPRRPPTRCRPTSPSCAVRSSPTASHASRRAFFALSRRATCSSSIPPTSMPPSSRSSAARAALC